MSGPNRQPPPDQLSDFNTSLPVIHLDRPPINKNMDTPTPSPPPTTKENAQETEDLMPNRPIALYFDRNTTRPGAHIMMVRPSLHALNNNERYTIESGNDDKLFTIDKTKGMASLTFTKKVTQPTVRKLTLTCVPIKDEGKALTDHIKLLPFSIVLELHIL